MTRRYHWSAVAILLMCFAFPLSSRSLPSQAENRDLVVMVYALDESGRRIEFGAGIVVSQTPARTVIITADHVVRVAAGEYALEVEFAPRVGRPFPATAFSRSAPRPGLDLAVLFVEPSKDQPEIPHVLTDANRGALRLADPADVLKQRALIVGNMNDRPWSQNFVPDPIVESDQNRMVIESSQVDRGASGGAVFDTNGQLIGMVVTAEAKGAVARPIRALLDKVREWQIEIGLRYEDRATTTVALERLRDLGLRFQAQSLSESLSSVNLPALSLFQNAGATPAMLADALRMVPDGSKKSTALRFFESAAAVPRAAEWFGAALKAGLDPNMTVPGEYYPREALVHLAVRAGNYRVLGLLLDAGASPHGVQDVAMTPYVWTRFMFPLQYVLDAEQLSLKERREWVEKLIAAGAVVPRTLQRPGVTSWASGMHEAMRMLESGRERLGTELPVSSDLCSGSASRAVCTTASDEYGFDWCRFVDELPNTMERVGGRENSLVSRLRLSYLLNATAEAAYFLAVHDPVISISPPGYVLVRVSKTGENWTVWHYTEAQGQFAGPCTPSAEGVQSQYCWVPAGYSLDLTTKLLKGPFDTPYQLQKDCGPFLSDK